MAISVFGHTNPDTDSVTASLALTALFKAQGKDAEAFMQIDEANLNPESKTVLKRFGLTAPKTLGAVAGKEVALVDFSDLGQGPEDLAKAEVVAIVDHHKLGDVTTNSPLLYRAEPVGCTGTILNKMFKEAGVTIPKDIAGGMLSAILSDTVNFKSPTCTEDDKVAVAELKGIAGVTDTDEIFMEMLKAKSAVAGIPAKDLLYRDYKDFDMNGKKVGVNQLEMIDITALDERIDELFEDMQKMKEEEGLHTMLVLLTDIMKEGSQLLCLSDDASKIEAAFKTKLTNNQAWLDGVLSRKKQVIPFVQPQFN